MIEFLYLFLIAFTAGTIKGLTGFGSSLVAIPLLLMLYPSEPFITITTILITSNVILNFILMFENKAFTLGSLKKVYTITIFGFIFTFVGLFMLKNLDPNKVNYIAASLILFAIIVKCYQMFWKNPFRMKENKLMQALVGAVSGIGNGFGSIDGPPVVFYLSMIGADKKQFKNTMVTHALMMGLIGVTILIITQSYNLSILIMILCFTIGASIGTIVGMFISKSIKDDTFQYVVLIVLIILDIKMYFF